MALETEFELEITKIREVKTPEKAWSAAGWDFFVPTNLNIKDFTKNYGIYVNDNLVRKHDQYSPSFLLKNKTDNKELWIKFFKKPGEEQIKYLNCNSGKEIAATWNNWIENPQTIVISIDLNTNEKILIPSGIHARLPQNVFLNASNKSGIASKRGLVVGAQTIDYDYEGEIHIQLINVGSNIAIINAGDKIVQFIPYFQPMMTKVKEYKTVEALYKGSKSERGTGGFGSSDKKTTK